MVQSEMSGLKKKQALTKPLSPLLSFKSGSPVPSYSLPPIYIQNSGSYSENTRRSQLSLKPVVIDLVGVGLGDWEALDYSLSHLAPTCGAFG